MQITKNSHSELIVARVMDQLGHADAQPRNGGAAQGGAKRVQHPRRHGGEQEGCRKLHAFLLLWYVE
jgi:hypothetical protein